MQQLRIQGLDRFHVSSETELCLDPSSTLTMEEATERANKTLGECRGLYNRLRRESITIDLLGALYASKVVEEVKSIPGKLA